MSLITHTQGRPLAVTVLRLLETLHATLARHVAIGDLEALSDETLSDIGIDRHDIATSVDAGTSRIGLLALGR